jgi:hypothetical protein
MSDGQKKVAWDIIRACFWLLATIIWSQILFAFVVFSVCAYGVIKGSVALGSCTQFMPINELLMGGMAVVIAFSGRGPSKNG